MYASYMSNIYDIVQYNAAFKNTNAMVRSPGGDIDFFDIVTGVFQGDTLAPYLSILCVEYVLRTSIDLIKENCFTLKKKNEKTISHENYDLALLANTPTQAESLLQSLEQATGDIGQYVNENKVEYMSFKQKETVSTLSSKSLKLVDQFTYLGSNILSTEIDVNIRLEKVWNIIDWLSSMWKSNLSNKIKPDFFQSTVVSILLYGCTT